MSHMNDTTLNNSNSGGGGGGGNSSSHQLSFLPGNTTLSNGLAISSGHEVTGVASKQQRQQQQPMTSCSQHSSIVGGGGGGTSGSGGSEIENMLRSHVNLMVAIQKSQSDLGMHVQHSIASIITNVANLTEEVKPIKAFLHQVVFDRALKDELVSWRTLADSLISRNEASHKLEIQRVTELFGTLSTTNAAAMAGGSTGGGPSSASAMSAQQQAVLLQYLSQAMYPAAGLHQYGVAGMPPPSTMPAANVPRGHSDGQQMPASVGASQLTGQFSGVRDIKQVTKVEQQQQPAGGIGFGSGVPPQQATLQAPQQQSSQPSAAGDMNRFKLNPATQWRCSLCYLENELSRAKCISCNSDQPASNKIQQQQQASKQQPAVAVKPQEPVKPQVVQATPPSGGSGGASSFRFVPPSAAANTPHQVTPPQPAQQPQQGLFKPAPTFVFDGSIFGKPPQSTTTINSTPAGSSPAAKPAGASHLTLFGGGMSGGSGGFADLAQKSAASGGVGLFSNTGSKGSSSFLSDAQASGNSPFGQPPGLFQKPTPKAEPTAEDGEAGGDDRPEAFVPDAHYEPVVPLPALVEMKHGNDDDKGTTLISLLLSDGRVIVASDTQTTLDHDPVTGIKIPGGKLYQWTLNQDKVRTYLLAGNNDKRTEAPGYVDTFVTLIIAGHIGHHFRANNELVPLIHQSGAPRCDANSAESVTKDVLGKLKTYMSVKVSDIYPLQLFIAFHFPAAKEEAGQMVLYRMERQKKLLGDVHIAIHQFNQQQPEVRTLGGPSTLFPTFEQKAKRELLALLHIGDDDSLANTLVGLISYSAKAHAATGGFCRISVLTPSVQKETRYKLHLTPAEWERKRVHYVGTMKTTDERENHVEGGTNNDGRPIMEIVEQKTEDLMTRAS